MADTYTPLTWYNGTPPPIDAANLNHIEGGINDAFELHRDLISGVTPTLSGWTVDPTDHADITDGDISTFCTTGNKVTGAGWQYAYFEWDLGAFYNVLCGGVGASTATAGSKEIYVLLWDGAAWVTCKYNVATGTTVKSFATFTGRCSKVRLGITGDAAATITPNIREFNVWRMG